MKSLLLKISLDYIFPPIPIRRFDWCAYLEDHQEGDPMGWGKTRYEAVIDLMENMGDLPGDVL